MTGFVLFVALHAYVLVSHSNCFILERGKMCLREVRTATTGCEEEDFSEHRLCLTKSVDFELRNETATYFNCD